MVTTVSTGKPAGQPLSPGSGRPVGVAELPDGLGRLEIIEGELLGALDSKAAELGAAR